MIHVHEITQGTDDWHKIREGKFTGSTAYKLLGSFGASEYARARQSSFAGNYYTKRGHVLEDEAIELYEQIQKTTVDRPGFVTNDLYPECGYSPDGIDGQYLLEVKCFGEKPHMEILGNGIPVKILAQIHFGMLICEKKLARLILYNPELEAREAFWIIDVPFSRNINNNFKRILA